MLEPGGTWRLATDWGDYADQIDDVLTTSDDFDPAGRVDRFEGRPLTRFEVKGTDAGRLIHDFRAVRRTLG